jgi:hypothetical protein
MQDPKVNDQKSHRKSTTHVASNSNPQRDGSKMESTANDAAMQDPKVNDSQSRK